MKIITAMEKENVSICFIDVSEKLVTYGKKLNLRDYYTVSIYFRIFIPGMFPEFKKAIYLDADMVILELVDYKLDSDGDEKKSAPKAKAEKSTKADAAKTKKPAAKKASTKKADAEVTADKE